MITKNLRIFLTAFLLIGVWYTSPWPLALVVTIMAMNTEYTRIYIEKEREYRTKRQQTEYNLFKKAKKLRNDLQNMQDKIKKYGNNAHIPTQQPKAHA